MLVLITKVPNLLPVTRMKDARMEDLLDQINNIRMNTCCVTVIIYLLIVMNLQGVWLALLVLQTWTVTFMSYNCGVRPHILIEVRDQERCSSRHMLSPRDNCGGGSPKTCFTCVSHGHFSKGCPSKSYKPTCHTCGDTGHLLKTALINQDLGQLHLKFVLKIGTPARAPDNNFLVQVIMFKTFMLITTVFNLPLGEDATCCDDLCYQFSNWWRFHGLFR